MNNVFKRLAILTLVAVGFTSPTCKAQEDIKTIEIEAQAPQEILPVLPSITLSIDTMIEKTRLTFFDALVKEQESNPKNFSHLIDPSHINSITFLDENNGQILLSLIAELEKNQNSDSPLLQSLNELCMLEFYKFLCSEIIDKETRIKLTTVLGDLYHHEAMIDTSSFMVVMPKDQYPFRTLISKTLLTVSLVNNSRSLGYEQKCETIAFLLTHLKQEFVAINNSLTKNNQVSPEAITYFIEKLSVIGINAPLISAKTLKTIIIITVVIAIVATVIYVWYNYYGGKDWVWNNLNAISNTIKSAFRSAGEEVAAGASEKIKKTVEEELAKLFEKDKDGNDILKANIKQALKDAGINVVNGATASLFEKDKDGNDVLKANIKQASKDTGKSIIDGATETLFIPDPNDKTKTKTILNTKISQGLESMLFVDNEKGNKILKPELQEAGATFGQKVTSGATSTFFDQDEKGKNIALNANIKKDTKLYIDTLFKKINGINIPYIGKPSYTSDEVPPSSQQANDDNNCNNNSNKNGFTDNIEFPEF